MDYNFLEIEPRIQKQWDEKGIYKVSNQSDKPKYYVLDMFPYPSGAGLHVGHPLGYIASDIYARYKRLCGFNVLHPMGFDAYGLPAEQYAIQTGQHPEITTEKNIARYIEQLRKIGFCYDWDRQVRTCDPKYYHWTQWAFARMFEHYFDNRQQKALPISDLVKHFETQGTEGLDVAQTEPLSFSADEWKQMPEKQKQATLMNYRIAYLADTKVNWCPKLGTVLANDEVSEGLSVRGGYPVEQRVMRQWSLRVSAYAQRLLDGLDTLQWTDSLKETQRNWIGRSEGAEMMFQTSQGVRLKIFTTRADTIFGVTFMVLAPESEYVSLVTTEDHRKEVDEYLDWVKHRTERERISDRKVTGVFTGSYAINPVTHKEIPIYISDYVLSGYGTGAIMAVPAHDSRDYAFAKHFNLPIIPLIEGADVSEQSFDAKEGTMMNSGFLNGLQVKDAIKKMKEYIEAEGIGKVKVNYRLRDAIFSRQRYWGEPFPVYYKDGMPYLIPDHCLPLELPEVKDFKPTEDGRPPLGNATCWAWDEKQEKVVPNPQPLPKGQGSSINSSLEGDREGIYPIELCTMPGFAGSSAYYLRYMDPHNDKELVSRQANEYWQQVDLYLGGSEHATGHLIYSRFWNKFLFDLGLVVKDEPFRQLINQGMIQGRSNFVYRATAIVADEVNLTTAQEKAMHEGRLYVSQGLKDKFQTQPIHADVNIVSNDVLDIQKFCAWMPEYKDAEFVLEDGVYKCGWAVEKMSKSMFNVVNPDDVIKNYGADTLRLYEMFLGPLEMSKPWDTNGIDGVHRFLKRFWSLFDGITDEEATKDELRTLHKTIKKVTYDIEHFSFNTSVPAFMIAVNELAQLKCHKRQVLEPMLVLLSPFAPHIAEELWQQLGHKDSIIDAAWPKHEEKYLEEDSVNYPVQFNGKMRFTLPLPKTMSKEDVEKAVLQNEQTLKYTQGATPKRIIVVPGKIVNIVL
ncbi:MAG: leucine--tRNA ligase [Paludibacteraceae bacterium]|nr:leucine--tRNA ligase [Paludibacteraceae bacterium]